LGLSLGCWRNPKAAADQHERTNCGSGFHFEGGIN
jgi:hypothetical protein